MPLNVLIVGGSGYLGQFLVQRLSTKHNVLYTYHTHPLPDDAFPAQAAKVDVTSVADFTAAFQQLPPHVVINCAAISQPAVCEQDYSKAAAINVPTALLAAVEALPDNTAHPYIIHISTDQVSQLIYGWVLSARLLPCVGLGNVPSL
jgi:dTDP-4-dehydrorhamnose reductase